MDISMEATIDLSEENDIYYPDIDISVDDPAHFRADDDDHDIVPRASTPRSRSSTSEPPLTIMTEHEHKRKRTEDIMGDLSSDDLPPPKRSESAEDKEISRPSLLSLHHVDTGEMVPRTQVKNGLSIIGLHAKEVDDLKSYGEHLQQKGQLRAEVENLQRQLKAQELRFREEHDKAILLLTTDLKARNTELEGENYNLGVQVKELKDSLCELTNSSRKAMSELKREIKQQVDQLKRSAEVLSSLSE